jgi:hypothetical protein
MQQAKAKSVKVHNTSGTRAAFSRFRATDSMSHNNKSSRKSPKFSLRDVINNIIPAIIILSGFYASSLITRSTPQVSSNAEVKKCESNDFYCYGSRYALLAYDKSSKAAYDQLKIDYAADPYVVSQCHQLTHIIGRTIYKKTGDLTKTFAEGDSFCWSGFHHGVIEQAIGVLGATKIQAQLNTICDAFSDKTKYSFDHFNCVHGLGHGMMTIEGFELFTALEDCQGLDDNWERLSCQGGAYMENTMVATRETGSTKFLKEDDLLYPCNSVRDVFKEQCYLTQTSYMLQKTNYDFAKVFSLCANADAGYLDECYQSVGRDASGSTNSDVTRTIQNCQNTTDQTAVYYCMVGASKDFVSYYHSDIQANRLCDAFGEQITTQCRDIVRSYYATF